MTNPSFHHTLLIGRPNLAGVTETLTSLSQYLEQQGITITVEQQTASLFPCSTYATTTTDKLPTDIDLIIVVGGDGSLITASHTALAHNIPVLGINRGRLGFLTDIRPDNLESIGSILKGHYHQESRFLIQADLHIDGVCQNSIVAINDIVLMPGDIAHMIEFDTFVNDQLVYHQRADGMIIATPTGSTAYALSGGGPIIQPGIDALVLVPMFPHTLSSRPIVLPSSSHIKLTINEDNDATPYISNDGIDRIAAQLGSEIHITQHEKKLQLIHPLDYNYFTTLRDKLGWEHQASRR